VSDLDNFKLDNFKLDNFKLDNFNGAPAAQLRPRLLALTAAAAWADRLLARRPYVDLTALFDTSDDLVRGLEAGQVDAALAGHPRIGERAAGLDEQTAARSATEQAAMASAGAALKTSMARGNTDYERRFGRIYLVAAAGRSAEELLGLLHARLDNDPDTELQVVRDELARITRLRLGDLFPTEDSR
jgi:2-oxo-4-hydroxy-4-carboxy-5-ureidoimidazoline decarboxylase